MAESKKDQAKQRKLRVPNDLLAAAVQNFSARFGLEDKAVNADDMLLNVLEWVAQRPGCWLCDKCQNDIPNAASGRMQWRFDHATGAVDNIEIVHTACARSPDTPERPMLRLVGQNDPHSTQDDGNKAWTVLPLAHLTDDDGLVQLLDFMCADRLPRHKILPILQRLHVRDFDNAAPYLLEAMQEERFKPNLSEGLYWQGDLQEALRAAPDAPMNAPSDLVQTPSGPRTISAYIHAQKPSNAEALVEIVNKLAIAGVQLARNIACAPLDMHASQSLPAGHPEMLADRLDKVAHGLFLQALVQCTSVAGLLSEEEDEPVLFAGHEPAKFLVALDPLDGSDNSNYGATTGAIFGILPRRRVGIPTEKEFLRPAAELALSGYIMFGHPLQLVIELEGAVAIFAYDMDEDSFIMTSGNHMMPDDCHTLSVNDANSVYWSDDFRTAISTVHQLNGEGNRKFVSRFSGAMVADVHRVLLTGGVFAVPGDTRRPNGKLRHIYECNPISRIILAAGGFAFGVDAGFQNLHPKQLHAKTPFIVGVPCVKGHFQPNGDQTV